jgi:hypothetical protein
MGPTGVGGLRAGAKAVARLGETRDGEQEAFISGPRLRILPATNGPLMV